MPSLPGSLRGGAASLIVVTADQVDSRTSEDAVPDALHAVQAVPSPGGHARGFARTAGDEIQALFTESTEAVAAIEHLIRLGQWRVGLGVGPVGLPVPSDVRAASGDAFVAAREAVEASRLEGSRVAVRAPGAAQGAQDVEAALGLLSLLWQRRTRPGWQVAELSGEGMSQREIATRLAITPSAVSQRARSAAVDEAVAGKRLVARLLDATRAVAAETQ